MRIGLQRGEPELAQPVGLVRADVADLHAAQSDSAVAALDAPLPRNVRHRTRPA